jgi:hypothetical protein
MDARKQPLIATRPAQSHPHSLPPRHALAAARRSVFCRNETAARNSTWLERVGVAKHRRSVNWHRLDRPGSSQIEFQNGLSHTHDCVALMHAVVPHSPRVHAASNRLRVHEEKTRETRSVSGMARDLQQATPPSHSHVSHAAIPSSLSSAIKPVSHSVSPLSRDSQLRTQGLRLPTAETSVR